MRNRSARSTGLLRVEQMVSLRGQVESRRQATGGEVFADADRFRRMATALFLAYDVSTVSLREREREFYASFKHLLNGKPVDSLPAPSLDPEARAELKALADSD